jgi:hypothetical protein
MSLRNIARIGETLFGALVLVLAACTGSMRPSTQSTEAYNLPAETTASSTGPDPLCGDHWRWDGTRCIELPRVDAGGPSTDLSGLKVEEVTAGQGTRAATIGDTVRVHYTGTLANGTMFDSSKGHDPLEFKIGSGMLVKGFERGCIGMRVGGKRRLHIPPHLGYGARGAPPRIPPDATLVFDIEMIEIE